MNCPKCGAEIEEGSLYCGVCGEDIHIVPDFESEVEQSMQATLEHIAEELQKQLDESEDGENTFDDAELIMEMGTHQNYFNYDIDTRVYAEYTDQEQIKEIVSAAYASELVRQDWDNGKALDRNYSVIVYFKTDSPMTRNYGTSAEYGFLEGQIPGFVKEDTVYKE